jgi:hypothetical protein
MTSSEEYRALARECMKQADAAKSESERKALLDIAATWLKAAALVSTEPPTDRAA